MRILLTPVEVFVENKQIYENNTSKFLIQDFSNIRITRTLFSINCNICKYQKQPPRGVPRKSCSEILQQIYRRTPMPKCNFNKVVIEIEIFIEIALRHGCSPVNLLHIFRTPFLKNTSGWLFLKYNFPTSTPRVFHVVSTWNTHDVFVRSRAATYGIPKYIFIISPFLCITTILQTI